MKDKKDRDKLIEKAKEMIKKSSVIISKRGAARYIKVEFYNGKEIDENRIKEDERWDGYYAIETNSKQLQPLDIFRAYHNLWKIEEGFRILKSHIKTMAISYWTNKRIRGHIALCFISFLIERIMELELSKNNIEYSAYIR